MNYEHHLILDAENITYYIDDLSGVERMLLKRVIPSIYGEPEDKIPVVRKVAAKYIGER